MKIETRMPGSCGELVQGTLDGIDFHITCPINKYSHVTLAGVKSDAVSVPEKLDKTAAAVKKALDILEAQHGIEVQIQSELPRGKGMASSTADIAAAVYAVFELFECRINPREIADIALSVEPTDGTIFDGIVAFDHIKGRILKAIGDAPPIEILVLEPPTYLDTIGFNKQKGQLKETDQLFVKEALEMAIEGFTSGNLRLIGNAATLSSILNQKLLYKPEFDDVMAICKSKGGLGVNIAHSGTVLGMLVEKGFGQRLFDKVSHYIPRSWEAYVVELVNGGVRCAGIDGRAPAQTVDLGVFA